jgi:hypothetical protein
MKKEKGNKKRKLGFIFCVIDYQIVKFCKYILKKMQLNSSSFFFQLAEICLKFHVFLPLFVAFILLDSLFILKK